VSDPLTSSEINPLPCRGCGRHLYSRPHGSLSTCALPAPVGCMPHQRKGHHDVGGWGHAASAPPLRTVHGPSVAPGPPARPRPRVTSCPARHAPGSRRGRRWGPARARPRGGTGGAGHRVRAPCGIAACGGVGASVAWVDPDVAPSPHARTMRLDAPRVRCPCLRRQCGAVRTVASARVPGGDRTIVLRPHATLVLVCRQLFFSGQQIPDGGSAHHW